MTNVNSKRGIWNMIDCFILENVNNVMKQTKSAFVRPLLPDGRRFNATGGTASADGRNTNQTTRAVKRRRQVPRVVYPAASVNKHGRSVEILSAYILSLMGVQKYSTWKNLFVKTASLQYCSERLQQSRIKSQEYDFVKGGKAKGSVWQ